ncbi:MAG: DUF4180 domain-containing protein [Bacteroidales bacterium]|jgi:hypothetical protein
MNTIIHSRNETQITEILDDGLILKNVQDFLDIIANSPSRNIILHKENIIPELFDLKTKIAGDILQKASNYRIRIGIVGDYKNIKSKSLRDFIYESNKTKEILFKENIEDIIEIFGKKKKIPNKCFNRIIPLSRFVQSLRSLCTNRAKPFGHGITG